MDPGKICTPPARIAELRLCLVLLAWLGPAFGGACSPTAIPFILPVASLETTNIGVGTPPLNESVALTGIITDLRIDGPGYFVVRDPEDDVSYLTRWGGFHLDNLGYLVNSAGLRLQGYSDAALTLIGDLRLDPEGSPAGVDPTATVDFFWIYAEGEITVLLTDGTCFVRAQILLQMVDHPRLLPYLFDNLYVIGPATGPLPRLTSPGFSGSGTLRAGELEELAPYLEVRLIPPDSSALTQGALTSTSRFADLAIQGKGWFVLRDPQDGRYYVSRAGAFYQDYHGYLVHVSGFRLQGCTNSESAEVGDVMIDTLAPPSGGESEPNLLAFSIEICGKITLWAPDRRLQCQGRILLRECRPSELSFKTNFSLYLLPEDTQVLKSLALPGRGGMGLIYPGRLELTQCDGPLLTRYRDLTPFRQGGVRWTGSPTDLAICGLGFFLLRDPIADAFYATRTGHFQRDDLGHLVTTNGLRLQGLMPNGSPGWCDLRITPECCGSSNTTSPIASLRIDGQGRCVLSLADGSTIPSGWIFLQWFRDLQALKPIGDNLYSNLEAAQPIFQLARPLSHGLGCIVQGLLEAPETSPPLILPPTSGIRVLVKDGNGHVIEASDDGVVWSPLGQVDPSGSGQAEFFDPEAISKPCRFYRARAGSL
jgi:flagellar hook protein FlgE